MLGKSSLFVLGLLCMAVYQAAGQAEGERGRPGEPGPPGPTPGGPAEPTEPVDPDLTDLDVNNRTTEGQEGPVGPGGRPRPGFYGCTVRRARLRISRTFALSGRRRQTCYGYVSPVNYCRGYCPSSYYSNPTTLQAVSRCSCCRPSSQRIRRATVTLRCTRYAPRTRRVSVNFPEATRCVCQGC